METSINSPKSSITSRNSNSVNKKLAAKTLIAAVSKIERFITARHKEITDCAQHSYLWYNRTSESCEKIINLICQCQDLHNLGIKIENLLEQAPPMLRKILTLHYAHQIPASKIAEMLGKTQRTIFRYLKAGIDWFVEHMDTIIDDSSYVTLLHEVAWFRNIQNRLQIDQK